MAFAELVFLDNNPQAGSVLKAIVKVLNGETNVANIEGLTTISRSEPGGYGFYKTEIINPNNEAWALEYPAVLPTSGWSNFQTAVISSPCITASKKKMVRFIIASGTGVFTEPTGGAAVNYPATTNWRMYAQGVSAVDASGAIEYGTWRNNNGNWALINKSSTASTALEPFVVTLSWSARHLFVMCNNRGITSGVSGVGIPSSAFIAAEIDENPITQFSNSVPCVYGYLDAVSMAGAFTSASTDTSKCFNVLKTYIPSSAAISNIVALGTNTANGDTQNTHSFTWCGDSSYGNNSYNDSVSFFINKKKYWNPARIVVNEAFSNTTMGYLDLTKYTNIWMINDLTGRGDILKTDTGIKYKVYWLLNYTNTYRTNLMVKYG